MEIYKDYQKQCWDDFLKKGPSVPKIPLILGTISRNSHLKSQGRQKGDKLVTQNTISPIWVTEMMNYWDVKLQYFENSPRPQNHHKFSPVPMTDCSPNLNNSGISGLNLTLKGYARLMIISGNTAAGFLRRYAGLDNTVNEVIKSLNLPCV